MPKIAIDSKIIDLDKVFLVLVILILLAGNVFFWMRYSAVQQELEKAKETLAIQEINEKVLDFSKLFIEKVLKTEGEIDFENRLILENAVRNLGDEEVLNQWQKFTGSQTEAEAQIEVKNLLELLVLKIKK